MSHPVGPNLSSDQPIHTAKEDILGRELFAIALANAFSAWNGDESLVIALYGPWGSGKTSAKNLILELLSKAEKPLRVMEFNPWAWSGQDRLMSAFFTEIGLAISDEAKEGEREAVTRNWKKYAARLSLGGSVLGYAKTVVSLFGVPVLPLVLGVAEKAVTGSAELMEKANSVQEAEEKEEPLEVLKKAVGDSLKQLERPLLIVIDDIDRLSCDEIRLLFQLVKANADFPNTIFFLLFERNVVEQALNGVGGSNGREYMEKIIQAGFNLPEVDQARLDKAFWHSLEQVLLPFNGWQRWFDSDRWNQLYSEGLQPLLDTMRDVRRFVASLSFTVGLFFQSGTLEINIIDLIGIEAIRIFEPEIYRLIPAYRETLLRTRSQIFQSEDRTEERRAKVEQLLERADKSRRDAIRNIFLQLFPILSGLGWDHSEIALRELRSSSETIFPRYFVLAVPPDDIPQSLIDQLLEASRRLEDIRRMLVTIRDQNQLPAVLDRIDAYKSKADLSVAENFITALYDVGDSLSLVGEDVFLLGPASTASRIVFHWLKREEDDKARGRILLGAIKKTTGLYLPVDVVSLERQRESGGRTERLLDEDDLKGATKLVADKLATAAKSGQLIGNRLGYYLSMWYQTEGPESPKAYAFQLAQTAEGSLQLLQGFTGEFQRSSAAGGPVQTIPYLNLKTIEAFVPLDQLTNSLSTVLKETEDGKESEMARRFANEIRTFQKALRRRGEGKGDDVQSWMDEED